MKNWGWGFLLTTIVLTTRAEATYYYQNFTDPYGVTGQYKLEVPGDASPQNPKGVLVYLHGDGAGDFDRNDNWATMKKLAEENGLMLLSVKSPPSPRSICNPVNKLCWWVNAERNGRYLDSVLKSIESKYGMDKSRTLFSGQSGGSTFLAGEFLPKYGKEYGGGALLACNGMLTTLNNGLANGPDPEKFHVDILTSERDFLKGGANGVYNSYKRHGFKNLSYFSEPIKFRRNNRGYAEQVSGNHCQFENGFGSWLTRTAKAVFADKKTNNESSMASREPVFRSPEVTSPYFISTDMLPSAPADTSTSADTSTPADTSTHSEVSSTPSEPTGQVSLRKREGVSARPAATRAPSTRRSLSPAPPRRMVFGAIRALIFRFRR